MMSLADEPTRCGLSFVPVIAASPDIICTTSSSAGRCSYGPDKNPLCPTTMRCGYLLRNSSAPSPCFSSCPSRKFSRNTSALSSSRCMVSRSSVLARSSTTLRLPRLNSGKNEVPMPPRMRVLSPAGGSTLITSAPSWARIMPQVGPITMWVISMTLTPSSGSPVSAMLFSRIGGVTLGLRPSSGKYNLGASAFSPA